MLHWRLVTRTINQKIRIAGGEVQSPSSSDSRLLTVPKIHRGDMRHLDTVTSTSALPAHDPPTHWRTQNSGKGRDYYRI